MSKQYIYIKQKGELTKWELENIEFGKNYQQ